MIRLLIELSCLVHDRAQAAAIADIANVTPGITAGKAREARTSDPIAVIRLAGDADELANGLAALRDRLRTQAHQSAPAVYIENEAGRSITLDTATDDHIHQIVHHGLGSSPP
jgi:hypothetical protein